MAIVHPTNRCNHRCAGCECSSLHSAGAAEIPGERLLRLLQEIADLGAASILFSGGGEPTLHREFPNCLELASRCGLLAGVFTNGSMLGHVAECLCRYASFVRISVDAATANSYAAIREIPPSAFDRLLASIRELVERKNGNGSRLRIGLKFLVRPSNLGEIPAFVELAEGLGVNSIQFKPLRNSPSQPSPDELAKALRLVDASCRVHSGLRIEGFSNDSREPLPCWLSPLRVVVSAEGDVQICNYFHHRRATHTIGNVHLQPLREIWFGDAHRKALAKIRAPECRLYDCRFHRLNRELLELVEQHRHQLDFV
jgi:MoaA/NifB/PqqE/SkfB family radical SAM enzyme